MSETTTNNKRIAKNTFMLYIRMFVMMAVSLYTSRVVLQVLGETDYGIYNIIGGVVVLFSFLNSALLQATQRFLNFELGKGNLDGLNRIFCMSMNAYILLSLLFFILSETLGLWFVNTQLNIPADRMTAANWVYQFSIVTFIVNLIRVPYNATIIAYERMTFFAYLSLLEVVLKLLVVYFLFVITWDKLSFFALFYTLAPLLINYLYKIYCNRYFSITYYRWMWDGKSFRQLFSFSGWSLFGSIANILASQGLNILVNIFYGVTVNAAIGIANQISAKVSQFMTNFQMAFTPQIVKKYAANEEESLYRLIFSSSKFSYYVMLIISLPLILEMDVLLNLWLVEVPEFTKEFSQLILIFLLIDAMQAPLWLYVQATGEIKKYQILMGGVIFLNFPLAYVALKISMPVFSIWIIRVLVNLFSSAVRCFYIKKKFFFPLRKYVIEVIGPICLTTILIIPLPYLISLLNMSTWVSIISVISTSIVVSLAVIFFIGINAKERELIRNLVIKKISIYKNIE